MSLDGAGLNGLITTEVLSLIEDYAFNRTLELGIENNVPNYNNRRLIATKDMFNMTASLSVTSFLAVGLATP